MKIKFEELKRNSSIKTAVNENFNKNVEDDLIYYKNLVREYERQIEDMKKMNYGVAGPSIPSKAHNNLNYNYDLNSGVKSEIYKNFERDRENVRKYQITDESQQNIGGYSLDNFRRNKVISFFIF
jgi:hypothetical protein